MADGKVLQMVGVRCEREGHAAVVVLDWPERRNAMNQDDVVELIDASTSVARGADVYDVLITGNRAFCTGGDRAVRRIRNPSVGSRETLEAYVDVGRLDLREALERYMDAAVRNQVRLLSNPAVSARIEQVLGKQ